MEPTETPEVIAPRDWLHNVVVAYGVRSVRHIREDSMNVRTLDGREFIITIREIAE